MCQKNGIRCYNDSHKKVVKLTQKLGVAETNLKVAKNQLASAARKSDFNAFSKVRKNVTACEEKVATLTTAIRHTQRDVDSTLTGRRELEAAMAKAETKAEMDALDVRRRTGEAVRFTREHALSLTERNYVPPIRFASLAS